MLLDFDDYRPDAPRITAPISVREAILLSLLAHAIFLIVILLFPDTFLKPSPEQLAELEQKQKEPLRFVEIRPLKDIPAPPKVPAVQSDMDRRATTRERAPNPENTAPVSRGNTPEPVIGGPKERSVAAGQPEPPAPPAPDSSPPLPETAKSTLQSPLPAPQPPQQTAANRQQGNLGNAFRNLDQYLRDDTFSNRRGGQAEQSADIQFDSMGVDFGPWLRRFKAQVERNWIVPAAVESYRGRVVIHFGVMRNGTIVNLQVLSPGPIPALTTSALSALKLSNPTAPLPAEYPVEPALITVTFHYNEFFPYGQ